MNIDYYQNMSVGELAALVSMIQSIMTDKHKSAQSELRKKTQRVEDLEKQVDQLQHDVAA